MAILFFMDKEEGELTVVGQVFLLPVIRENGPE